MFIHSSPWINIPHVFKLLESPPFFNNLFFQSPIFLLSLSEIPLHPPVIIGVRAKYKLGELLTANCSSGRSYPPANLTWFINGEMVSHFFLPLSPPQWKLFPTMITNVYGQLKPLYGDRLRPHSMDLFCKFFSEFQCRDLKYQKKKDPSTRYNTLAGSVFKAFMLKDGGKGIKIHPLQREGFAGFWHGPIKGISESACHFFFEWGFLLVWLELGRASAFACIGLFTRPLISPAS